MSTATSEALKPLPLVLGEYHLIPAQSVDSPVYVQACEAQLLARAEDRRLYEQGLRQKVLRLKHRGFEREMLASGELKLTLLVEIIPLRIMPTVRDTCAEHLQLLCAKCNARYNSTTGALIE
jgi:hypothetical protein